MGLISCPECNNQVSESAKTCPRCAYPLKEDGLQAMWNHVFRYAFRVALALPIILTVVSLFRSRGIPWIGVFPAFMVGFVLSAVALATVAWIQGRRSAGSTLDGRHSAKVAWSVVVLYVVAMFAVG
jgi:hypothetical protein